MELLCTSKATKCPGVHPMTLTARLHGMRSAQARNRLLAATGQYPDSGHSA
ncbi:hypothetical protein ACFXJ8_27605 [Nonomuraea sp. NPDC059194]|uniref:hypothetical protein n=1 Tax=Nonomuraea sp. NPDC059194 TaxID=3346764 RepID=UPI0036B3B02F